ncbi:MAG TPA: DUF2845 domain-containing protein [Pseudomonadales bacterium]|nr:DUF2845 domain-containing protein [Pseudomonadales bacterium]
MRTTIARSRFTTPSTVARRRCARALLALVVAVVGLPVCAAGALDSMRCDRVFIRAGDSKFQVLKACGDPLYQDQISGEDGPRVEQWVYASDWSRFDRMITFVAGKVVRIERLDD